MQQEQQVFLAGIRKPRLGNQRLLKLAQDKGWLAPQGTGDGAWKILKILPGVG